MNDNDLDGRLFKGQLALSRGDCDAANKIFSAILSLRAGCLPALLGVGIVRLRQRRYDEARGTLTEVLQMDPANAVAWLNLGHVLHETGALREAMEAFQRSYSLAPLMAENCQGLGRVHEAMGNSEAAMQWYQKAIALRGDFAAVWYLMAVAELRTGRLDQAAGCLKRALQEEPANCDYLVKFAEVLFGAGRLAPAMKVLDRLLRLYPANATVRSDRLMSLQYLDSVSPGQILNESRDWDRYHAFGLPHSAVSSRKNDAGRLRIGYLSPDFYSHSVGLLIAGIIKHHDQSRFEVFCYYCGQRHDKVTGDIQNACHAWRDISRADDESAAQLIVEDQLDLLIDLAGHSADNRMGVFARKPAPRQVSWLGYAHTTGVRAMDWFIADKVSVPEGEEGFFSEKILKLPHFRIPFSVPALSPEIVPPPAAENGFITFGSFNNPAKLNNDVIRVWSDILNGVPDSRLVLKWKTLESRMAREYFKRLFAHHGIHPERIDFSGESSYYLMQLEYGEVDIALDPFPYSGCLTTYNALWMGVPVITMPGTTPISRQSAAILEEIGLTGLVAGSPEEYVAAAVGLASSLPRLSTLRSSLRDLLGSSRLADSRAFASNLESIYRHICSVDEEDACPRPDDDEVVKLEQVAEQCYDANQTQRTKEILDHLPRSRRKSFRSRWLSAKLAIDRGKRNSAAVRAFLRVAEHGTDVPAFINAANIFKKINRLSEARASFNSCLRLDPASLVARYQLAGILLESARAGDAVGELEEVVRLDRYSAAAISGYLFATNYSDTLSPKDIFEAHRKHAADLSRKQGRAFTGWRNRPDPCRKVKVGYVSGDFGAHPVTYFLLRVFEHHNRDEFELYCYSNRPVDDDLTCYFREHSHHWRSIREVDAREAAGLIRQDGIDILVDLAGYSKDNRVDVFCLKPAPLQVSWLGYPNTSGIPEIDYRITDAVADPPGVSDEIHTERLLRLPGTFLCYYPPPEAPKKLVCPYRNNGYITFGSFNNLAKITPRVLEVWASIMRELPTSRLLMKRDAFSDAEVRRYFEETFESRGIAKERLLLRPSSANIYKHINIYQEVDIALDSFPYNGTTTTCEALWMGVPVVAVCGDRHAARVGASILTEVGLQELIAHSLQEYVEVAVAIARDDGRREFLRHNLRKMINNSLLGNGAAFTKNLEDAYRTVWRSWCAANGSN
jgi:predicted O-linked N-acetylglucosamine transferase (SPINDLY family)